MLVGWAQGAEVAPGNVGKIFSLGERAEVTREMHWKQLSMETPSLPIPPSWGRCCSRRPT